MSDKNQGQDQRRKDEDHKDQNKDNLAGTGANKEEKPKDDKDKSSLGLGVDHSTDVTDEDRVVTPNNPVPNAVRSENVKDKDEDQDQKNHARGTGEHTQEALDAEQLRQGEGKGGTK